MALFNKILGAKIKIFQSQVQNLINDAPEILENIHLEAENLRFCAQQYSLNIILINFGQTFDVTLSSYYENTIKMWAIYYRYTSITRDV